MMDIDVTLFSHISAMYNQFVNRILKNILKTYTTSL